MPPLPPAFVVSADPVRLAQFRAAWRGVGLPPDAVAEWRACMIPGAPSLGNAIAQYALARHALAAALPALIVMEDDAIPCDDCAALLGPAIADAAARGVAALRLGWLPLPVDDPPPDGRAVLGSQAFALLSRDAIADYCDAWPTLAKADAVFAAMRGRVECAPRNLFAQYVPRDAVTRAIHAVAGRANADPRLQQIRADYAAQYHAAMEAAKCR